MPFWLRLSLCGIQRQQPAGRADLKFLGAGQNNGQLDLDSGVTGVDPNTDGVFTGGHFGRFNLHGDGLFVVGLPPQAGYVFGFKK